MRLLLDTNVLLLLVVGLLRRDRIGGKRLEKFTDGDFLKVAGWAAEFPKHVSLPNILTETANLLGDARQELVLGGLEALATYVSKLDEVYVPSARVVKVTSYLAVGLTDSAILEMVNRKTCVVSVDHHLCGLLVSRNIDVRNPFHYR